MKEKVKTLLETCKSEGIELAEEVQKIISEYADPVDAKVKEIEKYRYNCNGDLAIEKLIQFTVDLQALLMYVGAGIEAVGVSYDNAQLKYVEKYNKAIYSSEGNQTERNSVAEVESIYEKLVANIYDRAYKSLKNRMTVGMESLAALKKALSVKSEQMMLAGRGY